MRRYGAALGLILLLALALAACKADSEEVVSCGAISGDGGDMSDGPPPVDIDPITTGSGLQYCDIEVGSGEAPEAADTISVHYTGWLQDDGSKFDSSVDRGRPFTFQIGVGNVIRGWDEGVATMQVGGKRRLIIPADLGYGAQGSPPVIPPNSTLIFDVELLEIQ